jgi:hypothetical protein
MMIRTLIVEKVPSGWQVELCERDSESDPNEKVIVLTLGSENWPVHRVEFVHEYA